MRFILFFLVSFSTSAQIANSSIFSEMKSINPAVVSGRKLGQITVLGTHDKLDKNQDLESIIGEGATSNTVTKMQQYSFFRGGKGPGLTTELSVKKVDGDVVTNVKTGDQGDLESKSPATSSGIGILIGLNDSFGIGFNFTNFKRAYEDEFKVGSDTYKSSAEIDLTFITVKPGIRFGSSALRFGLFGEYIMQSGTSKSTSENQGEEEETVTSDFPAIIVLGAGVGFQVGRFNVELSYESFPFIKQEKSEAPDAKEPPTPLRISGMIEGKLGKFTIGYKGSLYKGMFTDVENILSSQLLYPRPSEKGRLEHTFNFAIGSDKGLALGGSAFISKTTTEEVSNFGDKEVPTTTDAFGFSVKVGYVF